MTTSLILIFSKLLNGEWKDGEAEPFKNLEETVVSTSGDPKEGEINLSGKQIRARVEEKQLRDSVIVGDAEVNYKNANWQGRVRLLPNQSESREIIGVIPGKRRDEGYAIEVRVTREQEH